ncbi:protein phosphatase 2C domain-containing protein [Pseudenhygromyxa sp. WMMC2535]|nr:protein phosphatase 2C domain-containing protein [Pseudenhygromyxa sp. WMMC2535]
MVSALAAVLARWLRWRGRGSRRSARPRDPLAVYDSFGALDRQGQVPAGDDVPYTACFGDARVGLSAATVRGRRHRAAGVRCEDAHRCVVLRDGQVLIAVSDGVGSSRCADIGARLSTMAAIDYLMNACELDVEPPLEGALSAARRRLESYAQGRCILLEDLACTLLLAVFRGGRLYTARIGDGGIVIARGGEWSVATAPARASRYVTPLTTADWRARWDHGRFEEVEGVCVFTDGLERAYLYARDGEHEVVEHVHAAAADSDTPEHGMQALCDELLGPTFEGLSDDDKTLVVLWRSAG